jgi:hypothetical protein
VRPLRAPLGHRVRPMPWSIRHSRTWEPSAPDGSTGRWRPKRTAACSPGRPPLPARPPGGRPYAQAPAGSRAGVRRCSVGALPPRFTGGCAPSRPGLGSLRAH